jgi:glutaredoxin
MKIITISLVTLALLAPAANAQTMYRWVDKDGKVHYSDQPPPKEIKKVAQPRLSTSTIETGGPSFEAQQAAKDFPVTLYSAPDCTSECATARAFLTRRGIPFGESRVVTQADGEAFKKALKTDKLLFPALTVGSHKQVGFEDDTWNSLLDMAGYPRTAIPGAANRTPPAPAAQ